MAKAARPYTVADELRALKGFDLPKEDSIDAKTAAAFAAEAYADRLPRFREDLDSHLRCFEAFPSLPAAHQMRIRDLYFSQFLDEGMIRFEDGDFSDLDRSLEEALESYGYLMNAIADSIISGISPAILHNGIVYCMTHGSNKLEELIESFGPVQVNRMYSLVFSISDDVRQKVTKYMEGSIGLELDKLNRRAQNIPSEYSKAAYAKAKLLIDSVGREIDSANGEVYVCASFIDYDESMKDAVKHATGKSCYAVIKEAEAGIMRRYGYEINFSDAEDFLLSHIIDTKALEIKYVDGLRAIKEHALSIPWFAERYAAIPSQRR